MKATDKIWMSGELVDWADAKVHIGVHGLHYGTGVFEGIRCYETADGPAVFRLTDHLSRLHNSARLIEMKIPWSPEELQAACNELIGANGLPECYLRPVAFYGYGELGVRPRNCPVEVSIISWPWGTYLGEGALENGIRAKISTWERIGPNVIPHVSKATGIYLNSLLAVQEVAAAGYDEAILLTREGYVADGSGENIFIVKNGQIATPGSLLVDPPGHHARLDHPDRPGPRLSGRGEEPDPLGSLPRGRGLHVRHRRRGDAASLGRRLRARGTRPCDSRDPVGVPGHGARQARAVVALARSRSELFRSDRVIIVG